MDFNVQDPLEVIESQLFEMQNSKQIPIITRGSVWGGSQITQFRQIPLYGDVALKNIVGTINFTYNYINTRLPNTTSEVPNISIGKKVNVTINPTVIDNNWYIITYLVYSARDLTTVYKDYSAAIINVTKNNNVQLNKVDGAFLTGICKRVLQSDNSTRMLSFQYINAENPKELPAGPYYYTIEDYHKANIYEYN